MVVAMLISGLPSAKPLFLLHRTNQCQITEKINRYKSKLPKVFKPNCRKISLHLAEYGLIEVKLGGETLINEGVETLTSLAKQIDTTRMKAPAFKMILTATGEHAYRRPEDGIYIVPIGCLKQ